MTFVLHALSSLLRPLLYIDTRGETRHVNKRTRKTENDLPQHAESPLHLKSTSTALQKEGGKGEIRFLWRENIFVQYVPDRQARRKKSKNESSFSSIISYSKILGWNYCWTFPRSWFSSSRQTLDYDGKYLDLFHRTVPLCDKLSRIQAGYRKKEKRWIKNSVKISK